MHAVDVIERLGKASQGLVTAAALRRAGVGHRHLARAGAAVVKVARGVYATRELPPWPRHVVTDEGVSPAYVAHVRAVLLSLGDAAVACGRTAAVLRGWALLVEPGRTVEVAVPHGRTRQVRSRVWIRQRRHLEVAHVAPGGGAALAVTSAVQTAIDCCLLLPLRQAVVACDSALRSGQVTLSELLPAAASLRGVRQADRVRRVLELCDPMSGSVLESVLRLAMVLGGMSGFETQKVLRVGRQALRVDFCFDDVRLVVEADGQKWHQDVARDRERDNALARLGYRVLRYTWADVVHDIDRVLDEIREAAAAPQGIQFTSTEPAVQVLAA